MIKHLSMMKRRDDMSVVEFRKWLLEEHVPMGKKIPGMLHYTVNLPVDDSGATPFDAVNEMVFADAAARESALATPEGKAAGADAAAHCSARTALVCNAHPMI
jgi:uncharacterized protein (TIGR02118 family)